MADEILYLAFLAVLASCAWLLRRARLGWREAADRADELYRAFKQEERGRLSAHESYVTERRKREEAQAELQAAREQHAEYLRVVKEAAARAAREEANAKLRRLYAGLQQLLTDGEGT